MENDQQHPTPGVYLNEINAFPNSFIPAATAVPAFIGYTPQATYAGKSYLNVPQKITSFAEFQAIYCFPDSPAPAHPVQQYAPQYYFVAQQEKPQTGHYRIFNSVYYSMLPDPSTIYYCYNSIRLFFMNGGNEAYIVSVGTYGKPAGKPMGLTDPLINPHVQLSDLLTGLKLLKDESEPTMYCFPDATLLSVSENGTLMQSALLQATQTQTAIALLDVIGGKNPDPLLFMNDITTFRENTGTNGLDYGAAYYPFIGTTVMQSDDINFTNLFGGDLQQLAPIINPPNNPDPTAATILNSIINGGGNLTVNQQNNALLTASKTYAQLIADVLQDCNLLPPGAGIAGVITTVDANSGPWQAPANCGIVGAASLPIILSDDEQAQLNVDPVSGKSINAIRFFNGLGILIWGARTLDGNSLDWRYLPVRRTANYIEQNCKLIAQAHAFQPNNHNTWEAVKSTIGSFLSTVWSQGGLQGDKPADAFSVECGLGATMTADDLLNGFMNVTVTVAITRPAEFIVIAFQQQMASNS